MPFARGASTAKELRRDAAECTFAGVTAPEDEPGIVDFRCSRPLDDDTRIGARDVEVCQFHRQRAAFAVARRACVVLVPIIDIGTEAVDVRGEHPAFTHLSIFGTSFVVTPDK